MSAPDFYFVNNAIFRHLHDTYGKDALVKYWRGLGAEHYAKRSAAWRQSRAHGIAEDWKAYFLHEPHAEVETAVEGEDAVLHVRVCPAIKHLRDSGREVVPYFCEHCDHVCGAMAAAAGYAFTRGGGMGSCVQRFSPVTVAGVPLAGKGG